VEAGDHRVDWDEEQFSELIHQFNEKHIIFESPLKESKQGMTNIEQYNFGEVTATRNKMKG